MGGLKFISWTPHKKKYDLILLGLIITYVTVFSITQLYLYPNTLIPLLIIKSTGTLAFILLFLILCIGPLARLNKKFLPFLYNRRHLGVTMFFISLIHGGLSIVFFHGFGNENPIVSLFTSNTEYNSFTGFPFMVAGFCALIYLMIMAITSHDFWLNKLSPVFWKWLHMGVYLVFLTVLFHVMSGLLQGNTNGISDVFFIGGFVVVAGLHLASAIKNFKEKRQHKKVVDQGYLSVGKISEIHNDRAKIIHNDGKSIAVFRSGATFYAVDNFCKHQGGPLGEGKILDGCITCPWHGYQYQAKDGLSPPPFEEKVSTYNLKMVKDRLYVSSTANPLGTQNELKTEHTLENKDDSFYIGWLDSMPLDLKGFVRKIIIGIGVLFVGLAILLPHGLEPIKDSQYNYTDRKEITGVLLTHPVPMLRTEQESRKRDYILVNRGKFSALKTIGKIEASTGKSIHGKEVKISATEISYDGKLLLELTEEEESFLNIGDSVYVATDLSYGSNKKLKGEIVDPKCFFGAMNPADGKLHKSCAIRCLSGGIPAVFVAKEEGIDNYYILLGEDGQSINNSILHLVGEDILLSGRTKKVNNWNYLYLNKPEDIKRLSYRNILEGDAEIMCSPL